MRSGSLGSCILLAVLLVACGRPKETGEYIARVGDATLTEAEIEAAGIRDIAGRRQYVSSWVTARLLYEEAKRAGITEAEDVKKAVDAAARQIAISALLQREVYNEDSSSIEEGEIEREYTANPSAYRLKEDVVHISYALFQEREAANALRTRLLRGAAWNDAVAAVQADPATQNELLRVANDQYFTRNMLYPEELWKIARTLNKGDISYVVRTNAGYCIVRVHDAKRQGEIPDLAYVRNEIRERLLARRRAEKYDELLATLRSRYAIDVRPAAGDTLQQQEQE